MTNSTTYLQKLQARLAEPRETYLETIGRRLRGEVKPKELEPGQPTPEPLHPDPILDQILGFFKQGKKLEDVSKAMGDVVNNAFSEYRKSQPAEKLGQAAYETLKAGGAAGEAAINAVPILAEGVSRDLGAGEGLASGIGFAAALATPLPGDELNAAKRLLSKGKKFLKGAEDLSDVAPALRSVKGLSADDIMKQYPHINLKKDVIAKDIHGNKIEIPKGEALTPYELKGNKVLLQDGDTYIVSKNQFQNIKGQSVSAEAKEFAPELKGLEESVRGEKYVNKEARDNMAQELFGKKYDELQGRELQEFETSWGIEMTQMEGEGLQGTKFSQYQLPEGKNYKEILIKAPGGFINKTRNEIANELFDKDFTGLPRTKKMIVEEAFDKGLAKAEAMPTFKSSHWDEPNVISHLRLNERTYKGKKVTFMEEAQSDWARAGREKGFIGKTQPRLTEVEIERLNFLRNEGEQVRALTDTEQLEMLNLESKAGELEGGAYNARPVNNAGVPFHPLVEGGKWVEPSVKRGLQEAVANDSEYFAWITGEQTSARYNLAKQLEYVKWKQEGGLRQVTLRETKGGNPTSMFIDEKGIVKSSDLPGAIDKKLNEVLGKGLADEIMKKETGTLSGEGLKFGGEWAENLYDKQIKNIVEDVTGGKVEKLDMGLPISKVEEGFKTSSGIDLAPKDIKVGETVYMLGHDPYIITKNLGNGKFKALNSTNFPGVTAETMRTKLNARDIANFAEEYDATIPKTTEQWGVKLTPEIKAKIRGETPKLKEPSGRNPQN